MLFVCNFNTNLVTTGMMETDTNIQYLRMLVCGEVLCQFDLLFADSESTETLNVVYIVKGLVLYFPPVNSLSKEKRVMCRGMKNRAI